MRDVDGQTPEYWLRHTAGTMSVEMPVKPAPTPAVPSRRASHVTAKRQRGAPAKTRRRRR